MNVLVPQITAQLDFVLSHNPEARVIAIQSTSKLPWPDAIQQRGRQFTLRWCDSMLAMRQALCDAEQLDAASAGLVLLTPLTTQVLAHDIAARLARRAILQPEGWAMVRQLFAAKEIDARLARHNWMPQLLLDGSAQGAYTPVANGFLDLETVWKELLQRFLQLETARPDATALLRWTMQPGADTSLNFLPPAARREALSWLAESGGIAGHMVLACIRAGRIGDALALGLVCGVLYAPAAEGQAALGHAAIRLERFVGDAHVGIAEGRAWATAAQDLVHVGGTDTYRAALDRADALLRDLRVAELAHLSAFLPLGLDQRMRHFAQQLTLHVHSPSDATLTKVETAASNVLSHALANTQEQRADRVRMARRIARWLVQPLTTATTVAELVGWQADEGAFVDWARFRLLGGDELLELSKAYEAMRRSVISRRNALGLRFANALPTWNTQAASTHKFGAAERMLPLESVLEQLVAPLAAHQGVLLLVMDGLSTSIFQELFARPERLGWTEVVSSATARPFIGITPFPTITEVSRAALLCGKLITGTSSLEKSSFATNPALLERSDKTAPPILFHKGELSDSSNLSSVVHGAICNSKQRIVGVVYNAVDDHLSGPDQLNQRWTLEDLRLILPILRAAKEARRVVIVTADHGHLLEDGTTQIDGGAGSDRWKAGAGVENANAIVLSGGRVRTTTGANSVTCLWSESVRYAGRKNGYHGGVSLQEVSVPLSVLVPFGMELPQWQPALPAQPEWWDLPNMMAAQLAPQAKSITVKPTPNKNNARKQAMTSGQKQLFDAVLAPIPEPPSAQVNDLIATQDWIGTLLRSPVYASQRALAARVALADDRMRALLQALMDRGGKLSRAALAQRISAPESGLAGLLSAARRVLNVDQAAVLQVDEAGTVELNRGLLLQQFHITPAGGSR